MAEVEAHGAPASLELPPADIAVVEVVATEGLTVDCHAAVATEVVGDCIGIRWRSVEVEVAKAFRPVTARLAVQAGDFVVLFPAQQHAQDILVETLRHAEHGPTHLGVGHARVAREPHGRRDVLDTDAEGMAEVPTRMAVAVDGEHDREDVFLQPTFVVGSVGDGNRGLIAPHGFNRTTEAVEETNLHHAAHGRGDLFAVRFTLAPEGSPRIGSGILGREVALVEQLDAVLLGVALAGAVVDEQRLRAVLALASQTAPSALLDMVNIDHAVASVTVRANGRDVGERTTDFREDHCD